MTRAVAKNFTMIPDEIMSLKMSFAAKCVYGFACRKADPENGFWSLGGRFLGGLWETNQTEIARGIRELLRAKLIQKQPGKTGARGLYIVTNKAHLVNKASHIDSVPGAQSESNRLGASQIDSEASHIDSRMIQRPLETKEDPLSPPEGGGENLPSQNQKAEKNAPGSDGPSEGQRTALALFYPSKAPSVQKRFISRALRDLATYGATPEEVKQRYRRWPEVFPEAICTLKGLVSHWDRLKPEPPNPYTQSGQEELARE